MTIWWHSWRNELTYSKNASSQRLMKLSVNWQKSRMKSLKILPFQGSSIALSIQSTLIQRPMRLMICYSLVTTSTYNRLLSPQISFGRTVTTEKSIDESVGFLSSFSWYCSLSALSSLLFSSLSANYWSRSKSPRPAWHVTQSMIAILQKIYNN